MLDSSQTRYRSHFDIYVANLIFVQCIAVACPTYRADDVEAALLGLESIVSCEVSRSATGSAQQHVWAVTFLEVN